MSLLRHAADRRSIAFAGVHFALCAVALGAPSMPLWLGVPLFVAMSVSSFAGAISAHNTMHSAVFRARWMNRAWQAVLSLTFVHPVSAFVPAHNLSHHRHLQTARDVLRTTEVRHRHNGLNLLAFAMKAARHMLATDLQFYALMRRRNPTWFRQLMLEVGGVLAFVALALSVDWARALLFIALPAQVGLRMIVGLGYPQHDGCDPESRYDHSRNFTGGLFNFIAFNNGYHGVHHMTPGLHWSQTPEAHRRELAPFQHPALDEPSLPRYFARAYLWPARRERFDGSPIALPPPSPPAVWLVEKGEALPGAALGAGAGE